MGFQRLSAPAAFVLMAVAMGHAAPPDLFDEIYARGRPIESNLRTLTARFTETTSSSLLARPLVARGTLAVVRPSKVVLQYEGQDRRTVLIDGDVMRMVWPSRSVDERMAIGATQRRIQRYFVNTSASELRSHFDIAALDADDRPGAWRVAMTPKRRQIREGLSRLDLWIDRTTVVLSAMRMTFPSGDTKLMEFEDVRINPEIDPGLFQPASR